MVKKTIPILLCAVKILLAQEINYSPYIETPFLYPPTDFFPATDFQFLYNVYDKDGDYLTILLKISYNNGQSWFTPHFISGDIGDKIRSNIVPPLYYNEETDTVKKDFYDITWHISKEPWWKINFNNLRWKIVADDHFEKPENFEWVTVPVEHLEVHRAIHDEQLFHIMKYEVTNAQYLEFLNLANHSGMLWVTNDWVGYYTQKEFVDEENAFCYLNQNVGIGDWTSIQWDGTHFYVDPKYTDHPVVFVTYKGAEAFCNFYGWQLPTATEWNRAALGNLELNFPWGGNVEYQQANFWNSQDPFDNGLTPVGFYDGRAFKGFETWDSPGYYGCYDMIGNVREWLRNGETAGCSWLTQNPLNTYSNSNTAIFKLINADFQTGFRCVTEFVGRK